MIWGPLQNFLGQKALPTSRPKYTACDLPLWGTQAIMFPDSRGVSPSMWFEATSCRLDCFDLFSPTV